VAYKAPKKLNNEVEQLIATYMGRAEKNRDAAQYQQAVVNLNKAISLNRYNPQAFFMRGNAYDELKAYEKALADYEQAVQLNPRDGIYFYYRGLAKKHLDREDDACVDWRKASYLGYKPADALIYKECMQKK
jgi:tetratricopeptide (TPR) repeat protein